MSGANDTQRVDNVRDLPLPYGWIHDFDLNDQSLWIDLQSEPIRAIRVHPFEDDQYLNEHPEVRSKIERLVPPSYAAAAGMGREPSEEWGISTASTNTGDPSIRKKKRNVLGKMKDKAIGTKEERLEAKRQQAFRAEQRRRRREQEWFAYQQQYFQRYGEYPPPPGYGFAPRGGCFAAREGIVWTIIGGIAGGILIGLAILL